MSGWIKLHRSLVEWEWWEDHNATRLLVYLLVSVNYENKKWRGVLIKAGSKVTSWEHLANDVGLSVQQTRTAIGKLEACGEITRKVTNRFQLITLVKWDQLQQFGSEDNKPSTNKQQAGNKQSTTTKEREESKEREEVKKEGVIFPFDSEEFNSFWKIWKAYKKLDHRFTYKSTTSEQAALKKLATLSDGDEQIALEIIEESIANGWKGFFKLGDNGKNRRDNKKGGASLDEIRELAAKHFD